MLACLGRRAIAPLFAVAALVTACAERAPLQGPVEAMQDSWGPFARQCVNTRVSYWASSGHLSPTEKAESHGECWGFSVSSGPGGASVVTASIGGIGQPGAATIVRFERSPGGEARAAEKGDTGLAAQGSDDPNAAAQLARRIGLSRSQMLAAHQTISLLVRLNVPDPVDVPVTCTPDGGGQLHGRTTVVLSCSGSSDVRGAAFDGHVRLSGVEEIDVRSGVVLASRYAGRLNGGREVSGLMGARHGDMRLLYGLETEFE